MAKPTPNKNDLSCFRVDACRGDMSGVKEFIDKFGSTHFHTEVDNAPYIITPFEGAIVNGRFNVARLMLEHGADINAIRAGHTVLMHMASQGKTAAAEFLLDNGADARLVNMSGVDAAYIARAKEHEELAEMIERKTARQPKESAPVQKRYDDVLKASTNHHRFKLRK